MDTYTWRIVVYEDLIVYELLSLPYALLSVCCYALVPSALLPAAIAVLDATLKLGLPCSVIPVQSRLKSAQGRSKKAHSTPRHIRMRWRWRTGWYSASWG